jgi:C-terminal processing protease CtpA/Prc
MMPVAVLVDAGTASAAELFAGCLKAHGRAVVVGERTHGKGEAQAVVASARGAVYGTVGSFTLPDGLRVQGAGVEPDLPWPSGDLETWRAAASGRLPRACSDAVLVAIARRR